MTEIDEDGFLGQAGFAWEESHRAEKESILSETETLNRLCHAFLSERPVPLDGSRKLVTALLYVRLLEMFQSTVLLAARGMVSASSVSFRALIEAYFHFDAIRNDDSYLNEFLDQFSVDRRRMASGIFNSESESLDELRRYFTEETVADTKQKLKVAGIRPLTTAEAAKRGGNEGMYRTAYALLSADVHTSARSLESHLICDEETGEIAGLKYGQEKRNFERHLGLSVLIMCEVLEGIYEIFGESVPSELKKIEDRQNERFKKKEPGPDL